MARSLPPMITARSLGAMPEFVAAEIGPRALERVMQGSGLPYPVLEKRDVFIPESMLVSFLRNAAREAGEDRLGLQLAPHLTVADYGIWGDYVLGAAALGESLRRVEKVIGLHSNDAVSLKITDSDFMRFTYDFAMRAEEGYDHIAACAVGVICSIFKIYLGPAWRPEAIDLDIARPVASSVHENAFGCPVRYDRDTVAVWFRSHQLSTPRPLNDRPMVTAADVVRARSGGAPETAAQKVSQLIMLQLLDGAPSLDDAARKIGVGPRYLQRNLASEGTTFRALANDAVARRSMELLSESDLAVADIAFDLGYSTPAHFARAFRKQTGYAPGEFRMLNDAA